MSAKRHFKLILNDEGIDVFQPRDCQTWGYRYGPAILVHDGICEAWFASPGDCYEADWFTYRRSEDGGKTWSDEKAVMFPTPDSMDWFSVCDPSVFKYGKYYYIGYTSTIFANGGGVCNNGFIARSTSPTGPFEKWCGNGWGEERGGIRWSGKPAPVIYFDEDWHQWGAGEFSFVVKDTTLYMYYTWTSKDLDGQTIHETRVATADLTSEDWPRTVVQRGVAVERPATGNDSYDVVYCDDLHKFVALSTDHRFKEDSFLAVYESDDGLRFCRVNEIKAKTSWMCHNCGISGDAHRHIRAGDTILLGYAYGDKWGCWGTRMHACSFEAMEEDFYSETHLQNVKRSVDMWPTLENPWPIALYLEKPHYVRLTVGQTLPIPMMSMNTCYQTEAVTAGVKYSHYDKEIINIRCGKVTGLGSGYTFVRATKDGLRCEFLVSVGLEESTESIPKQPYPDKRVVMLYPMLDTYRVSLKKREAKQIRGMAFYEDHSWFELAGEVDGLTYENHAPELFDVRPDGTVVPQGRVGRGEVTVHAGNCHFDVTVDIFCEDFT